MSMGGNSDSSEFLIKDVVLLGYIMIKKARTLVDLQSSRQILTNAVFSRPNLVTSVMWLLYKAGALGSIMH